MRCNYLRQPYLKLLPLGILFAGLTWLANIQLSWVSKTRQANVGLPVVTRKAKVYLGPPSAARKICQGSILALAFAADSKRLYSASTDSHERLKLQLLDAQSLHPTQALSSPKIASYLEFAPDLRQILVSDDSIGHHLRLQLYDISIGKALDTHNWEAENLNYVVALAFSSVGNIAATCERAPTNAQGWLKLWQVQGQQLKELPDDDFEWNLPISCATFSPDGKQILIGSEEGVLVLCDSHSYKTVWSQMARSKENEAAKKYGVTAVIAVAFTPNGKVVASAHKDALVCLWDGQTGKPLQRLRGHTKAVLTVAFSPDGSILASGSDDGTIKLWDAQTGQALRTLQEQHGGVSKLTFAPDGNTLASGYTDGTIALWRVK